MPTNARTPPTPPPPQLAPRGRARAPGLDGAPATAAPRRGGPAGGDFLAAAEHAVPRRRAGGRLVLGRGGGRRGRGDEDFMFGVRF